MEDRDPNQMGKIEFYKNEELMCSYRIYQGLLTTSQLLHSEANAFQNSSLFGRRKLSEENVKQQGQRNDGKVIGQKQEQRRREAKNSMAALYFLSHRVESVK